MIFGISGFIAAIFLIIYGLGGTGQLPAFIDIPSLFIVMAGFFVTFIGFSFSEIINAFSDAVSGNLSDGFSQRFATNLNVIKTMSKNIMTAGVIGSLMGIIFALGYTEPGNLTKTFLSLAISVLAILYSFTFKLFVFIPLEARLEKKYLRLKS